MSEVIGMRLIFYASCSFTRKLLVAVVDKWDAHVHIIDKVVPPIWKVWKMVFIVCIAKFLFARMILLSR